MFSLFVDILYLFSQICVLLELTNAQQQLREVCAEYRKGDTVIFIT